VTNAEVAKTKMKRCWTAPAQRISFARFGKQLNGGRKFLIKLHIVARRSPRVERWSVANLRAVLDHHFRFRYESDFSYERSANVGQCVDPGL
jgi:hypothetical protein